ncbi:MBL fold metallo-hydrolase [Thermoplasma sp.]|uniref:MBL fold metallo-hydrolase n=1 Tax=Thermoplasma sp. TaxID=1973142 RepID=UPI002634722B|nr:MBL fold metallo-hydrolase [Thermoplasma sp.]
MSDLAIEILNDGYFYLDAGAIFGVVPKAIWSKTVKDDDNAIRLATNVLYAHGDDISFLVDSGIGRKFNEKFQKIYRIEKVSDVLDHIEKHGDPEAVTMIINSHLHFDHIGHNNDFKNAYTYAQAAEFRELRYKNVITRSNYSLSYSDIKRKIPINGSRKIGKYITVIKTGGHTPGHQVILVNSGSTKVMYLGDLVPSTFHLKLPYRTAIDLDPLKTVEMKKVLIRKAIREGYVCIFNHDPETPAALLHGDFENPSFESVEI